MGIEGCIDKLQATLDCFLHRVLLSKFYAYALICTCAPEQRVINLERSELKIWHGCTYALADHQQLVQLFIAEMVSVLNGFLMFMTKFQ